MGKVDRLEYLTFMHIFNKELGFIYVKPKLTVPKKIIIDNTTISSNLSLGKVTPTVAIG